MIPKGEKEIIEINSTFKKKVNTENNYKNPYNL